MTDALLQDLKKAAKEQPPPGHAAIYKWLWDRYGELKDLVEVKLSWPEVAARMEARGLRSRSGSPPDPKSLRKTWKRVVRDRRAAEEKRRERAATTRKPNRSLPVAGPPGGANGGATSPGPNTAFRSAEGRADARLAASAST